MAPSTPSPIRSLRIPRIAWFGAALLAGIVLANAIFQVPLDRALSYGFFVAMILMHTLMHGGHGSHSLHTRVKEPGLGAKESLAPEEAPTHAGGCH